jgi:hypothetical protein
MGIQQQQNGVAHNRLAPFVHLPQKVAGQPDAKAADISGIPGFLSHLLARRLKPRDVLDALAMNGTALEELAALKDRLRAPQTGS